MGHVYPVKIRNNHPVKVQLRNYDTVSVVVDGLVSNIRFDATTILWMLGMDRLSAFSREYAGADPSVLNVDMHDLMLTVERFLRSDASALELMTADAKANSIDFASANDSKLSLDMKTKHILRLLMWNINNGNILQSNMPSIFCVVPVYPLSGECFMLGTLMGQTPNVIQFLHANNVISFDQSIVCKQAIFATSDEWHGTLGCSQLALKKFAFTIPDECALVFGPSNDPAKLGQTAFSSGACLMVFDMQLGETASSVYGHAFDCLCMNIEAFVSSFSFLDPSDNNVVLDSTISGLSLYAAFFVSDWSDAYMSSLSDMTMQDMMIGEVLV